MSATLAKNWAGFRWQSAYVQLPPILYERQSPTAVRAPRHIVLNEPLARDLGLDFSALASDRGAAFLAGNIPIDGLDSIAQAYAGHQFGHFTILGDGRAILVGEHLTPSGKIVDIQWKGAGRSSYSRGGDGRLALGPALQEFLVSEAMAALGVPTTRSLAVVETGEMLAREEMLPGAVLTRVAASHVRVGTFQFAAAQRDEAALEALVDFCIARHFPDVAGAPDRVARFLERVIDAQAELVAKWLSVGFIHGVMNTDNTAISGETIDFGPCAFLDAYDPATVFSSIDVRGRYAFGQQPGIAGWNLSRFAETLVSRLGSTPEEGTAVANALLGKYPEKFDARFAKAFGAKLGLAESRPEDPALLDDLLVIAAREQMDFHRLWIELRPDVPPPALAEWGKRWLARLNDEGVSVAEATARMRKVNPIVVPRNHRVEEALARAHEGDRSAFERLLKAVRAPFVDTPEARELGAPPAEVNSDYRTFCGT